MRTIIFSKCVTKLTPDKILKTTGLIKDQLYDYVIQDCLQILFIATLKAINGGVGHVIGIYTTIKLIWDASEARATDLNCRNIKKCCSDEAIFIRTEYLVLCVMKRKKRIKFVDFTLQESNRKRGKY